MFCENFISLYEPVKSNRCGYKLSHPTPNYEMFNNSPYYSAVIRVLKNMLCDDHGCTVRLLRRQCYAMSNKTKDIYTQLLKISLMYLPLFFYLLLQN